MDFRILGPLQVEGTEGLVRIPPGRQQVVLAALLLEAGRVVSTDYLVDAIWDEAPPGTARTQVQICVSRLRRSLESTDAVLVTRPPGYLLQVDDDRIDVRRCESHSAEVEVLVREGRVAEAVAMLRTVAELWRGPTLSGISSRLLGMKAAHLDETRVNLVETRFSLELDLGRHHKLIGELSSLVAEHPLRDRLRGQLMLALYRSGRQAEALDHYRRGRELLLDELGLEPGDELRSLEQAILTNDPALRVQPERTRLSAETPDPGSPHRPRPEEEPEPESTGNSDLLALRPRQLPADTADFIGRSSWFDKVESALIRGVSEHAVGVAVFIGRPGVGKSSMAVHIAHRLGVENFPDGQLYCDLRGSRNNPADTGEVLGRFLRALGLPGQAIPESRDERAEIYRSLLSTRRVLVVLDDASSERQVVDLLPGTSNCGVMVTSRSRLTGVPGATLFELDVLSMEHSLELLCRVVGRERVEAEPSAAEALVKAVGRLPLALRIVAARLAARQHWSLASMVNRLADERHRLDELNHGELGVRASLSLTYNGLDELSRRTLRLFSLAEGPSQPGWVAGALLDDRRLYSSDLLESLVDAQMLDVIGMDGGGELRYRFHDIIRLFAREELMEREAKPSRVEATERLVGGWLHLIDEANRSIHGGDYLLLHGSGPRWKPMRSPTTRHIAEPLEWMEREQGNMHAAVLSAADMGLDESCWDLATAMLTLFGRRCYTREWEATNERAMEAVLAAGNLRGIAALNFSNGCLHLDRRRNTEARESMTAALETFTAVGDELGRAKCLRELAHLDHLAGDRSGALEACSQAHALFESIGDIAGMGRTLLLSGHLRMVLGEETQGMEELRRSRFLAESTGDPRSCAQVLRRIGQYALLREETKEAFTLFSEAFELVSALRDPVGEGYLLHDLGGVSARLGRWEEARSYLGRALAVREQVRDRQGRAEVEVDLARVLSSLGHREQAVELAVRAARTFDEQGLSSKSAQAEEIIRLHRP